MRLFIHWLITVAGLVVAYLMLEPRGLMSIEGSSAYLAFAVMAVVLGLVNIFIRPILKLLSCGLIVLTLGLFMLVINAFLLWFSSWICGLVGIGLVVQIPWGALWGSIIISLVSWVAHFIFREPK
jgi:putative membrane protein